MLHLYCRSYIIKVVWCVLFYRPLMISTQRLTSLAFGLQDGIWGYKADYTEAMKKQAIQYALL